MVGLIQHVLVRMVEAEGGQEALAAVRTAAGVPEDRVFRIGTNYDDAECRRLVAAARAYFGTSEQDLMDLYAEYFGRDVIERFPTWFSMSRNARELLERQPVIHNCFASALRDHNAARAVNDKFHVVPGEPDELIIRYRSPNHLSTLYVALASWVLRYYGEEAEITTTPLPGGTPGYESAEIRVRWKSGPGAQGRQVSNERLLSWEEGNAPVEEGAGLTEGGER